MVFPPDGKRPVYCKSCRKKLFQTRQHAERKPVNKDELKKVLQAALEKNKEKKQGIIQPGETVYF